MLPPSCLTGSMIWSRHTGCACMSGAASLSSSGFVLMHVHAADTMADTELMQSLCAAQRSRVRAAVAATLNAARPAHAAFPASPAHQSSPSHSKSIPNPEVADPGSMQAAASSRHLPVCNSGHQARQAARSRGAASALMRMLFCVRQSATLPRQRPGETDMYPTAPLGPPPQRRRIHVTRQRGIGRMHRISFSCRRWSSCYLPRRGAHLMSLTETCTAAPLQEQSRLQSCA